MIDVLWQRPAAFKVLSTSRFYTASSNLVVWQVLQNLLSKGSHSSVKLIYLKLDPFLGQRGLNRFRKTFVIRFFFLMELSEVIIVKFSQQWRLQISPFAKKFFIFIGRVFRQVTTPMIALISWLRQIENHYQISIITKQSIFTIYVALQCFSQSAVTFCN